MLVSKLRFWIKFSISNCEHLGEQIEILDENFTQQMPASYWSNSDFGWKFHSAIANKILNKLRFWMKISLSNCEQLTEQIEITFRCDFLFAIMLRKTHQSDQLVSSFLFRPINSLLHFQQESWRIFSNSEVGRSFAADEKSLCEEILSVIEEPFLRAYSVVWHKVWSHFEIVYNETWREGVFN